MIKIFCRTIKYEWEQKNYEMQKTKIHDFLNMYHNKKLHAVVHYIKLIIKFSLTQIFIITHSCKFLHVNLAICFEIIFNHSRVIYRNIKIYLIAQCG
jgi:hypothetical protein